MKSRLISVAEAEFADGAEYYEDEAGLGNEFITTILKTIGLIETNPTIGRLVGKRVRSVPTRRFPYSIVYEIVENQIVIVAIAHQSRRPAYWHGRV